MVQYRGALMPLVYIDEASAQAQRGGAAGARVHRRRPAGRARHRRHRRHRRGAARPSSSSAEEPGLIGAAIVRGKAVEIVDVSHYLGDGLGRGTAAKNDAVAREVRLLLVDDSQFFRNMLAPLLTRERL